MSPGLTDLRAKVFAPCRVADVVDEPADVVCILLQHRLEGLVLVLATCHSRLSIHIVRPLFDLGHEIRMILLAPVRGLPQLVTGVRSRNHAPPSRGRHPCAKRSQGDAHRRGRRGRRKGEPRLPVEVLQPQPVPETTAGSWGRLRRMLAEAHLHVVGRGGSHGKRRCCPATPKPLSDEMPALVCLSSPMPLNR